MRRERQIDKPHLSALRRYGCWCCNADKQKQDAPTEVHHPRKGTGMGLKADDRDAIPLCSRHHNEQHPDSVSIHRNPIEWRLWYGTEAEVCRMVNEEIVEEVV